MKNKEGKEIVFKDSKDLLSFLRKQNPTFLRFYKKQYEQENKGFEVVGVGGDLKIRRIDWNT